MLQAQEKKRQFEVERAASGSKQRVGLKIIGIALIVIVIGLVRMVGSAGTGLAVVDALIPIGIGFILLLFGGYQVLRNENKAAQRDERLPIPPEPPPQ